MGQKLDAYFIQAEKLGGVKAKVKLAMITKMSVSSAKAAPDSPTNIKLFEGAMAQIKKSV
jgi:hypothetical protein